MLGSFSAIDFPPALAQVDLQLPSQAQSETGGRLASQFPRWDRARGGNGGGRGSRRDPRRGLGPHFLSGVFWVS